MLDIGRKIKFSEPTYFSDIYIYSGGRYDIGINYRGEKKDVINRVSCNFKTAQMYMRGYENWYQVNLSIGHEWSPKKVKQFYFGPEAFFGKRNYIKSKVNGTSERNTAAGVMAFFGGKFNLNKKFELRTEYSIASYYYKRVNPDNSSNKTKQGFGIYVHRLFSLELYYKF